MYTNKFLNILEKIFAGKRKISRKIPACEQVYKPIYKDSMRIPGWAS
jgi:hypothetical protein